MTLRHKLAATTALIGALFVPPLASIGTCLMLGTVGRYVPHDVSKLLYAGFYYWRDYGNAPGVQHALTVSLAGAGMLAMLPALGVLAMPVRRGLQKARAGEPPPEPQRAHSKVHGNADWLPMREAKRLFGGPSGVVIGEAYRVDQDATAVGLLEPKNKTTWGQGGKHPLLIDPCQGDVSHGIVFAGSGGYKTTSVTIPTLLHWRESAVVLDPALQAGVMTAAARRDMGQRVAVVGEIGAPMWEALGRPGAEAMGQRTVWEGFNVLDWIDTASASAEADVIEVVSWLTGDALGEKDKNSVFRDASSQLITCLLADILWDDALPAERKTLRELRHRICTPEKKQKGVLQDIHDGSCSAFAQELAGTLMDAYHETFSGVYFQATTDTNWLSVPSYAGMVSEGAFRTDQITQGNLTVFLQIPMRKLRNTPQLGRVVLGALLNALYRAEGRMAERVLFLLDEVDHLKKLDALMEAWDNGRKFGITMIPMWQNMGQPSKTWGKEALSQWMASAAWVSFAAVNDQDTADRVEKLAGQYTVLARNETTSHSHQSALSTASTNTGKTHGLSEQPRALIRADEVRQRMRADEQIVFRRSALPLRCGRAIYFRRPEMLAALAADRFQRGPSMPDAPDPIGRKETAL